MTDTIEKYIVYIVLVLILVAVLLLTIWWVVVYLVRLFRDPFDPSEQRTLEPSNVIVFNDKAGKTLERGANSDAINEKSQFDDNAERYGDATNSNLRRRITSPLPQSQVIQVNPSFNLTLPTSIGTHDHRSDRHDRKRRDPIEKPPPYIAATSGYDLRSGSHQVNPRQIVDAAERTPAETPRRRTSAPKDRSSPTAHKQTDPPEIIRPRRPTPDSTTEMLRYLDTIFQAGNTFPIEVRSAVINFIVRNADDNEKREIARYLLKTGLINAALTKKTTKHKDDSPDDILRSLQKSIEQPEQATPTEETSETTVHISEADSKRKKYRTESAFVPIPFHLDSFGADVTAPYATLHFPYAVVVKPITIEMCADYSVYNEEDADSDDYPVSPRLVFKSNQQMEFEKDVTIELTVNYSALNSDEPIDLKIQRTSEGRTKVVDTIKHGQETMASFHVRQFCKYDLQGSKKQKKITIRHMSSAIVQSRTKVENPEFHTFRWHIFDERPDFHEYFVGESFGPDFKVVVPSESFNVMSDTKTIHLMMSEPGILFTPPSYENQNVVIAEVDAPNFRRNYPFTADRRPDNSYKTKFVIKYKMEYSDRNGRKPIHENTFILCWGGTFKSTKPCTSYQPTRSNEEENIEAEYDYKSSSESSLTHSASKAQKMVTEKRFDSDPDDLRLSAQSDRTRLVEGPPSFDRSFRNPLNRQQKSSDDDSTSRKDNASVHFSTASGARRKMFSNSSLLRTPPREQKTEDSRSMQNDSVRYRRYVTWPGTTQSNESPVYFSSAVGNEDRESSIPFQLPSGDNNSNLSDEYLPRSHWPTSRAPPPSEVPHPVSWTNQVGSNEFSEETEANQATQRTEFEFSRSKDDARHSQSYQRFYSSPGRMGRPMYAEQQEDVLRAADSLSQTSSTSSSTSTSSRMAFSPGPSLLNQSSLQQSRQDSILTSYLRKVVEEEWERLSKQSSEN